MPGTTAPGPRGRPFVGDLLAYEADRIGWLTANRERYGDAVRITPKMVAVHHVELAHQVLMETNERYTVDMVLRSSARDRRELQAYLSAWMGLRRDVWKSLAERLTRTHMQRFTSRLHADLRRYADQEQDILVTGRRLMGQAIVDFCVGGESDTSMLDDVYDAADSLFQSALTALVGGEARVRWARRPHARAAVGANERLLALLRELVARRQKGHPPEEPRDLLDGLLAAGTARQDRYTVAMLRTIIFASHGVPGTALAWIIRSLAAHPAIASKVAAEVSGLTPGQSPEPGLLPFTQAVINETLRLNPPQWLLTRTAQVRTEVGGYRIPAGTEVLICPYLIHRDPRWWRDPDQFQPERWLGNQPPHTRHAYLPFGAGPRVCPGSRLAMTHLVVVIALLAREYEVRLPAKDQVGLTCDGLLAPVGLTGGWWSRASQPAEPLRVAESRAR